MRRRRKLLDDHGKEAFSYLAVILLTLTTFYVSYMVSVEREWDQDVRNGAILSDMRSEMDIAIRTIQMDLISLHDILLIEVESEVEDSASPARIDNRLEGLLIDRLEIKFDEWISSISKDDRGFRIVVSDWYVDSQPISGRVEVPVPSSNKSDQGSGIPTLANGTVITGVNTTFYFELSIQDQEGDLEIVKDSKIEVSRSSLVDILSRKLDRYQISLEDGELVGLVQYIVCSLAQMKCIMGYGREPGVGEITPLNLLSNDEILNCLDLALLLLSQAHLRTTDPFLLSDIENGFNSAPGAGGEVYVGKILTNTTTKVDPAMIPLLGEGIFHENNPPSLEDMLRPMFYSIADLIVNRLVSYTGLDDILLAQVGGLKAVFDLGFQAANSLSRSLIGSEVIDAGQETSLSIFKGMLERSVHLDPEEENILIRSRNGVIWNGSSIDGYMDVVIPDMQRTYEIGLSDGRDEDIYYRASNGSIHAKSEYFDQSEEFYGVRCNIYRVNANYSFSPIEPPFTSRNILKDPEFIEALSLFLGAESGNEENGPDKVLVEKGRYAVRKATDHLFDVLTSEGNDDWERMWKGWNSTNHPSLDSKIAPLGSMIDLQMGPILELARSFAGSLIYELDEMDFISTLAGVEEVYHQQISHWISLNYERWVDRDRQMQSCRENRTDMINGNCSVTGLEIVYLREDILCGDNFVYCGKDNVTFLLDYPIISKWMGLGLAPSLMIDNELLSYWSKGILDSYEEVREREFNDGTDGRQIGWIMNEFISPAYRSFELTFSSFTGNSWNLGEEIKGLLENALSQVGDHFGMDMNMIGGRFMVPPPPSEEVLEIDMITDGGSDLSLDHGLRILRSPTFSVSMVSEGGIYNTDPLNGTPPYTTNYIVSMVGDVSTIYGVSSSGSLGNRSMQRNVVIDMEFPIKIRSNWRMFEADYTEVGTLWEHVCDEVSEARDILKRELNAIVEDLLGDSMSSLREVPPIIVNIVKGKDLDLFEITRVVSNITLDLSSTIRDAVKGMITSIMDMGVREILIATCNILGIDEIDLKLKAGAFEVGLHTEREALMGGEGILLDITLDVLPIGMHCYMSFNRIENASFDFNGTVTFDIGPLYLKMELDPFMMRSPHMISILVRIETKGGKFLRGSFDIPALDEFRSCQISIGDTFGVEPFIPIPPLGIQAVMDAGFRMRYRKPEELYPHLNEVKISDRNLTEVEIFDPRGYPLYGSTIDIEDPEGGPIASWRLEREANRYTLVGINGSNLLRWKRSIPDDGMIRILLRSPSGSIHDDAIVNLSRNGWISRDADGYGVWRYDEGTPGYQNGGALPTDIKSLLISIALSAVREAWKISYEIYGLSFDIIVPFMEKAIDLFMERFLSVVRELVIDVRMFLSIEIEDASGAAGGGLELSFQADGEAVAEFLGWLYENIKIFVQKLADPQTAGNYRTFPRETLSRCYIGLDVFMEIEMPGPVANMASEGVDLPDSLMLAITAKVNLAVPLKMMGKDVGGGYVSLGVYIMDAPDAIVSLFYDIVNVGLQQDFYLLKAAIWEEST